MHKFLETGEKFHKMSQIAYTTLLPKCPNVSGTEAKR